MSNIKLTWSQASAVSCEMITKDLNIINGRIQVLNHLKSSISLAPVQKKELKRWKKLRKAILKYQVYYGSKV